MALATTLTNSEIKNAAGTEEEFQRLGPSPSNPRSSVFARIIEQPAYPHRFTISHDESGQGLNKRRRSVIRFDKTVVGQVDLDETMRDSAYIVIDRQIGQQTSDALTKDVLANLLQLVANTGGAATTLLLDGTGTGGSNLLSGGI